MTKSETTSVKAINQHGPIGFVMFTAFIGALIYFSQQAHNFGDVLFAFAKALVWPGFAVYHILQLLAA
jgi:hypothetical protein